MNRFANRHLWIVLLLVGFVRPAAAADWHHPLCLDGGGYWRGRIPVAVRNDKDLAVEGEPVAVAVGNGPGEADLAGRAAEAIRVCSEQGVEMLFGLTAPDGASLTRGPIPAGSTLVLPVECGPKSEALYYVYFDSPCAWEVPDFLSARLRLVNGDVERGDGPAPSAWKHDQPDAQHRAFWTTEHPQSGRRCLKTVVAEGAEPTWIATRQHGIRVVGGAKYVVRAWVKAENVEGFAGWYIHVGNQKTPMLIAPMLSGGGGTYDWKQVTAEITAPAEANLADLGTVLRGTGTAWFDNVTMECSEPGRIRAVADRPERIELYEFGEDVLAPSGFVFILPDSDWPMYWERRAKVKVFNFAKDPVQRSLVSVDAAMLQARLLGQLDPQSVVVTYADLPLAYVWHGKSLLFEACLASRSADTYHINVSSDPDFWSPLYSKDLGLRDSQHNLAANPGFEDGRESPEGWTSTGLPDGAGGITYGFDNPDRDGLGNRCVKMHVPHGAPSAWRGWQQSVPVEPGRTYLLAAWVKCEDVRGGDVRVHAHRHTADGSLSKHNPMVSCGPPISGTTDWTLMSGQFTMPGDTVSFRLHLTMNTSGTVWHDGVLLTEIIPGKVVQVEGRPLQAPDRLSAWPVPAVVKVFQDDPVPRKIFPARIAAARNEKEPLQLGIRSGEPLRGVRVEVDPPTGPQGAKLDDVEVNVVGYVPIDHPTSYYRSESPAWHRKVPASGGACDGWPGMWPDPLLPRDTFDLAANTTQPVWITLGVGKDAPAGDYRGRVRLVCDDDCVAQVPLDVHVWDFTLPDESHVAAIYDVRLGPGARLWGKPFDEIYPEIVRFMAARRLCPDTIRPAPIIQVEDGRVTADFTEFDKMAEVYFDELKLPFAYTPWQFYLFGWGHPPKTLFGHRPYPGDPPYEGADRGKLRPEYKRAYQACLKAFWDHLKEKGWEKKVVLYISDEPFDRHEHIRRQMKALSDMIHEVDPEIPIYSSTWKHVPEWDGHLDVWGIGHDGRVAAEKMAELRRAGDRLWFTTDGQMCTDTPYCAVERLLPHYCFKYGVEAYEFWGVSWLTYDPYRFGWHAYIHQSSEPGSSYWVRYPNGDGFLLYPGKPIGHDGLVSSIRLEQAREGVEDYEYLNLLRQRIADAKAAGRDATAAEQAIHEAAQLVTIPNAGGRYSTKILPDPDAVYQVRRALGAAVEQLR